MNWLSGCSFPPLYVYDGSNDLSLSNQQSMADMQQLGQTQNWAAAQSQLNLQPFIHVKALQMLKMRLVGLDSKFNIESNELITCFVADGLVYIFFVINGKEGILKEEVPLFPSDKLITQFRMIR